MLQATASSPRELQSPTRRIDFQPLHAVQAHIYDNLAPRTVLRCGRRFGKTRFLESTGMLWAVRGGAVGWFCPEYKFLWPSFVYLREKLDPVVSQSKADRVIKLIGGGSIEFWSLDNENAGRSRGYDLVIVDEASVQEGMRERWEQSIAPTLLDRSGWAIMAGTPKGIDESSYFYMACTQHVPQQGLDWKEFYAPTSANPLLPRDAVERLKDEYPPLVYQQEYLAEFVDWSGKAFFALPTMLEPSGKPYEYPRGCDAVFVTIDSAVKDGREHDGTGAIFWAVSYRPDPKLWILDWDYLQIEGSLLEAWLPRVLERCRALATQCRARRGSLGALIEDKASGMILLQQARRRNLPAHAIDSKLTSAGKDGRAISVSGYVFRRGVRLTAHAHAKTVNFKGDTGNHLLKQVVGYHVGQKNQPDDLLDCFCYGVAVGFGDSKGW